MKEQPSCSKTMFEIEREAMEIKDSGNRRQFSSGSVRDMAVGKGRPDLLPMLALLRLSKHFEAGCKKYGDRNWEKGQPIGESFCSSALRHLFKFVLGMADEDHLVAAAWNVMCALETRERIKLGILPRSLDDLPHTYSKVESDLVTGLLKACRLDNNQECLHEHLRGDKGSPEKFIEALLKEPSLSEADAAASQVICPPSAEVITPATRSNQKHLSQLFQHTDDTFADPVDEIADDVADDMAEEAAHNEALEAALGPHGQG